MKKCVLVVAGGKGLRMGGDLPKQFIPVGGKPLLMHTLEAFYRWDPLAEIVLVLPEDHRSYWEMLCREIGCRVPHQVVAGGETRFHSVRNGLVCFSDAQLTESADTRKMYIAVHDGVRPFVSPEVITACFEKALQTGTAIPVVPVVDSLREKNDAGSRPVDRTLYVAVQTPQVFRADMLLKAYREATGTQFTDDASVVESMGISIETVDGNSENIKITTPFDLLAARAFIEQRDTND